MAKLLYLVTEDFFFVSHFLPMAQAARECGFEVVIATRVGDAREQLEAAGFRVIPVGGRRGSLNLWRAIRDFVQIFRAVRVEHPDVVHCISLRPVVIGGLAAKFAGAPALVLAPTGLGHLWLDRGLAAVLARNVARLVIGSWLRGPRTRYLFENRDDPREFGLDPDAPELTIVGGAGVDPNTIPFAPEPSAPPVKVAVVTRMIQPKGIAEAVAAVQHARATGAGIELHLFGDPDPANPLSISEAQLLQWSSQPGIAWHGKISDVAAVWRGHHVAMLLSYREGLPRALVEAAAAGRPIITSDVAGCREVVRDGREGILVRAGDTEATARALVRLAADPDLRRQMGAAAHARFRERFTAGAVTQTMRQLYGTLRSMPDGD